MATSIPSKPRRRFTWIVVLVGLLEIAALVAFFAVKGVATTVCSVAAATAPAQDTASGSAAPPVAGAAGGASGGAAGGAVAPPPVAADQSGGAVQSPIPSAPASEAPAASAAPDTSAQAGAGGNPADVKVSGDTNQIVDPNCVAKTAAGLLSENTPAPGPTCGPMKQPEALKAAEKQIQN
jgi:hypothetical protein